MDHNVNAAAAHFDGEESANQRGCERAALANGLTAEQAEECDDGNQGCPACPFKRGGIGSASTSEPAPQAAQAQALEVLRDLMEATGFLIDRDSKHPGGECAVWARDPGARGWRWWSVADVARSLASDTAEKENDK